LKRGGVMYDEAAQIANIVPKENARDVTEEEK
jgi:hypothetical protein